LHVEGIEFDSVTKTGQAMSEPEIPNELQATLMNISSQILAEASPYPTGDLATLIASFWRPNPLALARFFSII
jgi:hypothetical protein